MSSGVAEFVESIRKRGVRLWVEGRDLHYRAPKGALSAEEQNRLRVFKAEALALLDRAGLTGNDRVQVRRAPLAFSQLAHWNLYGLGKRSAIRQIASAMRLVGRLNVEVLRASLNDVVQRHDALRTKIMELDGLLTQEVSEEGPRELRVDDLTRIEKSAREQEILRTIDEHILEPVDMKVGPLFAARLLTLEAGEYVLILAMEHIISDAISMGILLRDVFSMYVSKLTQREPSLPPISVQFSEYAFWQIDGRRAWLERHGAWWNERIGRYQRVRFPGGQPDLRPSAGWGTVQLHIGNALKKRMQEWCRLNRTTIVMYALTTYAALVLRWCNESECLIRYQSDGRLDVNLEHAIGCFASVIYLRIVRRDNETFISLMRHVTDEYCEAYEHMDLGYFASLDPRPDFNGSTAFNWVPAGARIGLGDLDGSKDEIRCYPVDFTHPMLRRLELDAEPSVLFFDRGDDVIGGVHFPLSRFSSETMERFGRNFLIYLSRFLVEPKRLLIDIALL